jgi:hypothetical protein
VSKIFGFIAAALLICATVWLYPTATGLPDVYPANG